MTARQERLVHESLVADGALPAAALVVAALLLLAIAMPSRNVPQTIAYSVIDARAAAPSTPGRMPPPDAGATEGNVVDLTY